MKTGNKGVVALLVIFDLGDENVSCQILEGGFVTLLDCSAGHFYRLAGPKVLKSRHWVLFFGFS